MIRAESADKDGFCECVSCGRKYLWTDGHKINGGHFVGGRTNSVLFVEETDEVAANCHPQCVRCNHHMQGNTAAYAEYMLRRYGQAKVEALQSLRYQTVHFTREQLEEMRAGYKKRWKAVESLEIIRKAIFNPDKWALKITYTNKNGKRSRRKISPCRILPKHIRAICLVDGGCKLFIRDRIESAALIDATDCLIPEDLEIL